MHEKIELVWNFLKEISVLARQQNKSVDILDKLVTEIQKEEQKEKY